MRKKAKVVVNFILDNTGSMQSIKPATISGFNEYLQTLKERKKEEILFTLTKFNSVRIEKTNVLTPVKQVRELNDESYMPTGNTPLYDAVVETTEKVHSEISDWKEKPSILTVVQTDGEENYSQKHNEKCLNNLIRKLEDEGNWTFVFLGANMDVWLKSKQYGFARGNTMPYRATAKGMSGAYFETNAATLNYLDNVSHSFAQGGGTFGTSNFFKEKNDDKRKKNTDS